MSRTPAIAACALLLAGGCTGGTWTKDSGGGSPRETGTDLPPWTTPPIDTSDTTDTWDTTDTDPPTDTEPPADCSTPPPVGTVVSRDFPDAGEEFTFDVDGYLVTRSDALRAIVRTAEDGSSIIVAPFDSGETAGVDMLLDGALVVADEAGGALRRVSMEGAETVITGSLWNPNSLAVHQNGAIYSTSYDELYAIDPETGSLDFITKHQNRDLDGVAFADDYTTLWYNEDSTGQVWKMTLDADGEMVDERLFVELGTGWGELDGMTTDECGNLYVVRTDGVILRVFPDQTWENYYSVPGGGYTSAAHFGSGIGGWLEDHLYVMDRYGALHDIEVGLKGGPEAHLP